MDVLIFGSIIADITVFANNVKKIKAGKKSYFGLDYGSKIDVEKIEINCGGSAHNIAYGLAKMEKKVGIIGKIGNDVFGDKIFSELKVMNVDVTYVLRDKYPTGTSIVIIGEDKDRTILIYRGANDFIDSQQVNKEYINNFKWFVFTSVTGQKSLSSLFKAVKFAKKQGLKILANPSIAMIKERKKELKELIKMSDVVVMNEEEIKSLTGFDLTKSLKILRSLGPDLIVVTKGSEGVVAFHNNKIYEQKSYKVRKVDTTGAGDAFTVGLLHSLIRKDSLEYALKFGCACAALNIKSYGAVKNFPTEDDIIKMIGERNV